MSSDEQRTRARTAAANRDAQQEMTRFFIAYSTIMGALLAVLVMATFVAQVISENTGLILIAVVTLTGGAVVVRRILLHQKRLSQARDQPGRRGRYSA
ncbi:hypothetical protein [Parenemella sanctibonifatiensis]|uniref:hypothetical protein n=1 Tax=Parenemella sanctibonifatiensis TaxID=2016505 RepID=UPI001185A2BB|nr:hypothetical protein [Parenemella sanctibonifatiensis]